MDEVGNGETRPLARSWSGHGFELIETLRRLPLSYCACGLPAEVTLDCNVLRIDRPGELTAKSSTATVSQGSDQLITGSDKRLQGRVGTSAGGVHAQSPIAGLVFGAPD